MYTTHLTHSRQNWENEYSKLFAEPQRVQMVSSVSLRFDGGYTVFVMTVLALDGTIP